MEQVKRFALIKEWDKKETGISDAKLKRQYLVAFPEIGDQYFKEDKLYNLLSTPFLNNSTAISKAAKKCFENGDCNDWFLLNEVALRLGLQTENEATLNNLLSWVHQSLAIERNPKNIDTYSVIQYKLGNDEEAINAVKEAHQLCLQQGTKFKSTIRILRDLDKKKKELATKKGRS